MASNFETACKFIGSGISRDSINVVLTAAPEDANHLFFGSKSVILVIDHNKFPFLRDVLTELVRTTKFLTWLETSEEQLSVGNYLKSSSSKSVEECMIDIQKKLKFRVKPYIPSTDKLEKKFGVEIKLDETYREFDSSYCQIFISFKKPRVSTKPLQHPRVEAIKVEDQQMKAAQKAASSKKTDRLDVGGIKKDNQTKEQLEKKILIKESIVTKPKGQKRKPLADITNMVDSLVNPPKNVLQKRIQLDKEKTRQQLDKLIDNSITNPNDVATEFMLPTLTQSEIDEVLKL